MPKSADELLELLDIESIEVDLFRGRQPDTELQRVFGGQVAAQSLIAAARTTQPDFVIHSLHSYFLRPGDTAVPIVYDVEKLRDGRSFATRRVVARQHGRAIYLMSASFQIPEAGLQHQDSMPLVPTPDESIPLAQLFRARHGDGQSTSMDEQWEREWAALDVRYIGNSQGGGVADDETRPARAQLWVRVDGELPQNPLDHVAAFTYASDMTLIGAALVPHGKLVSTPGMQVASLDHTIWFHRPFRADEWWLFDQHSPVAAGGRGLIFAKVYTQSGELVASVAQEGLIRDRS